MRNTAIISALTALLTLGTTSTPRAGDYPDKPIRLVVPFAPGGGTDIAARLVAKEMSDEFKERVVIDNRPGGGTIIGSEIVANAAPDGYTLLMGSTTLGINPGLRQTLPYDTQKAFAPISQVSREPYVVLTNPATGLTSIGDLVAKAKADPGKLNYGSPGVGSGGHLAGELFKIEAGVDMAHVAYRGNGLALTDLLGGRIQLMFATVLSATPYIQSHQLRALAVTGPGRSPALPDVPTVAESGLPNYVATSWNGMLAPAGTPAPVVVKLAEAVERAVKDPDVARVFTQSGAEGVGDGPQAFGLFLDGEIGKWRKVIAKADIKPE